MIYIFDDRTQRRSDNEVKLAQFSDVVKFLQVKLLTGKSVEDSIIDSITTPDCIIFHKSYVFTDQEVSYEVVRELFTSFDVPVIIFSGGTEFSNKGIIQTDINADVMYQNMPLFLKDYKENGNINIDILIWGEKHKLNALLELQNEFAEDFFINKDPDEVITDSRKIERFLNNKCSKIDRNLGGEILAEMTQEGSLTWGQLMNIVDKNINKRK